MDSKVVFCETCLHTGNFNTKNPADLEHLGKVQLRREQLSKIRSPPNANPEQYFNKRAYEFKCPKCTGRFGYIPQNEKYVGLSHDSTWWPELRENSHPNTPPDGLPTYKI